MDVGIFLVLSVMGRQELGFCVAEKARAGGGFVVASKAGAYGA
jgi:uncharacterized phosphosugar-binding protein